MALDKVLVTAPGKGNTNSRLVTSGTPEEGFVRPHHRSQRTEKRNLTRRLGFRVLQSVGGVSLDLHPGLKVSVPAPCLAS
jgi:hypothetical protein